MLISKPNIANYPAIKVGAGSFVYLWKPDFGFGRERVLRKFNVLAEELWKTKFKLERDEYIIYMYKRQDSLIILSTQVDHLKDFMFARQRIVELDSGNLVHTSTFYQQYNKKGEEFIF